MDNQPYNPPKNVPEFLKALWDDIRGKNANGRSASFKEWYSYTLLWVIGAAAFGFLFILPHISVVLGILWAYKFWLHLRNTF